jgi:hypothetical protein|tara:strand:- start:459 stop:977 length:519 start_codon:yes stop_codon:yes gene_type:complete
MTNIRRELQAAAGANTAEGPDQDVYILFSLYAANGVGRSEVDNFRVEFGPREIAWWPTSNMTDYTVPTPFVASASSEDSGKAWRAFDGTNADWGTGNDGHIEYWLKIYMGGIPDTRSALRYKIQASTNFVRAPSDWTIEQSTTGAFSGEQTLLDTQSSQTFTSEQTRTFTIP